MVHHARCAGRWSILSAGAGPGRWARSLGAPGSRPTGSEKLSMRFGSTGSSRPVRRPSRGGPPAGSGSPADGGLRDRMMALRPAQKVGIRLRRRPPHATGRGLRPSSHRLHRIRQLAPFVDWRLCSTWTCLARSSPSQARVRGTVRRPRASSEVPTGSAGPARTMAAELRPGVEEHAASATTRATTMALPDLMIVSSAFLASIHRPLMCRRHLVWNSNESRVGAAASNTRWKQSVQPGTPQRRLCSGPAIAMPKIRADIPWGRSRR